MSLTEVPQMPQIELGLTPSLWSLWRKRRQWQIHGIDKEKDNYKDANKSCALGTISVEVNKRDLGKRKNIITRQRFQRRLTPFLAISTPTLWKQIPKDFYFPGTLFPPCDFDDDFAGFCDEFAEISGAGAVFVGICVARKLREVRERARRG